MYNRVWAILSAAARFHSSRFNDIRFGGWFAHCKVSTMKAGTICLIVLLLVSGCARHKQPQNSSNRGAQVPADTVRVSTEPAPVAPPVAPAVPAPEEIAVSRPSPFSDIREADRQLVHSAPAALPAQQLASKAPAGPDSLRKPLRPFVPAPGDASSVPNTRDRALQLPAPPQLAVITPAPVAPVATAQRTCCVGTAFLEPAKPARLQRVFGRVPGLRRIGKHADTEEGFVAAKPKREITLLLPREARALLRDGRMDLKASVDESGRVTRVELLTPKEEELIRLASYAASGWSFTPARVNDKTVPSEVLMHFNFGN